MHSMSMEVLNFSIKKRYLSWALVLAFGCFLVVKNTDTASWLNNVDWTLTKDYLAVILTWPVSVLVLCLVFMHKFSESIREFLNKMTRFKAPGFEVSQQQTETPLAPLEEKEQKTVEDLENKVSDGSLYLTQEQVREIVSHFEKMEFKYLNLYLVQNTKDALGVLANTPVLKNAFMQNYPVPSHIADPWGERMAMLNALIDAELITEQNGMIEATAKGKRFLVSSENSWNKRPN